MINASTLETRLGQKGSTKNRLFADLEALRSKHNLSGCVLIAFGPKAASATAPAAGRTPGFYNHMKTLGEHILASIDGCPPESGEQPTT